MEPRLAWGERTYVMGILNVTPDSFSGDGLATPDRGIDEVVAAAVEQAIGFVAAGAEILDVGAESTRPRTAYGDRPSVDEATEAALAIPVVRAVADARRRQRHRQHRYVEGERGARGAGGRRPHGERRLGRHPRSGHGRRSGRGGRAPRPDAQPGGAGLPRRRLRDRDRLAAIGGRGGHRARSRARADHRRSRHRLRQGDRGKPRAAPSAGRAEGRPRRAAAARRHEPEAVPRRAARRRPPGRPSRGHGRDRCPGHRIAGADIVRVHDVAHIARTRRVADAIVRG